MGGLPHRLFIFFGLDKMFSDRAYRGRLRLDLIMVFTKFVHVLSTHKVLAWEELHYDVEKVAPYSCTNSCIYWYWSDSFRCYISYWRCDRLYYATLRVESLCCKQYDRHSLFAFIVLHPSVFIILTYSMDNRSALAIIITGFAVNILYQKIVITLFSKGSTE